MKINADKFVDWMKETHAVIYNDMVRAYTKRRNTGRYYIGDPCYIIPDDQWDEFVEATFLPYNQAKAQQYGDHCDSVFHWRGGQELVIWSNGGDGTWTFDGVKTQNGANSFGVDAGIFCIIDLDKLPDAPRMEASRVGMLFDKEPDLYVHDWVVYINGKPDCSMTQCWQCGNMIATENADWECENGECSGCEDCFECQCEEE